jgi:hypothetical protein
MYRFSIVVVLVEHTCCAAVASFRALSNAVTTLAPPLDS